MTEPRTVVVVHPDDINLADAKAAAAEYNATVVGNPYCPRGQVFLIDGKALCRPWPEYVDDEEAV